MFTKAEEKKNFYLNCGKKEKLQSMLLIWKSTLGKDKCDMRRQLLSDFCTSPIGEIRSDDIGFVENGLSIRPKSISFFNLTNVSS
jgi:hypothetical protein